jgi:hypothetical protein
VNRLTRLLLRDFPVLLTTRLVLLQRDGPEVRRGRAELALLSAAPTSDHAYLTAYGIDVTPAEK